MKNLKRIWSILLALALVLSLGPPVLAAEGEAIKLSMTASNPGTQVGETIGFTIRADKAFSARGVGMTISYDPDVLEPELGASTTAAPFEISGPMDLGGKTAVRISFLPGLEKKAFSTEDALAVVKFKALSVTESSEITMEAAYFYDGLLLEMPVTKPAAAQFFVEPGEEYIPVTGINLNQTALTIEEGEMAELKASVTPLGASNPKVIWTSSNEAVAKVSGGSIKALTEGTATITATTADGGFTATCTVTVTPPRAGYTVKMPADTTAVIGGTVQIPVTISNEDGKTGYNAFDLNLSYDPAVLQPVTEQLSGMTMEVTPGEIHVLGYGEDRSAGSIPFVLEFKALQAQTTEILVSTARVDNSGNAVVKNASLATLLDDRTVITVNGYPVTLPEGFTGEKFAKPGVDYTFREPDDSYDYTVKATVDGAEVEVTDDGDGTYTIPAKYITGQIQITATRTPKTFKVTLGTDMTGQSTARYGVDYTAKLNRDDAYNYTVTVTVGGKEYTGYTASGDTYTIPGEDITGEIVFAVEKEFIPEPTEPVTMHKVTFSGSGAGAAQGNPTSVAHGSSYTLKLKQESGYLYEVSYKLGGKLKGTINPNADGKYIISNVTAPLEIIITKTVDLQLSVYEYVNLDQKTVFLVLVETELDDGKVFTYDGNTMYYSDGYDAWAWLVIAEDTYDETVAASRISVGDGNAQVLSKPDYDVNMTGLIDINDAQLVYDLYNGKYENFSRISMMKFLNADVNQDKKITVMDAAGVVARIK